MSATGDFAVSDVLRRWNELVGSRVLVSGILSCTVKTAEVVGVLSNEVVRLPIEYVGLDERIVKSGGFGCLRLGVEEVIHSVAAIEGTLREVRGRRCICEVGRVLVLVGERLVEVKV